MACNSEDVTAVRKLLEYGANPNVMTNEDDTILAYMNKKLNSTPESRGNLEMIVELLKEYGAVLE
ncbi:MAG: hypothetical protein IJA32_05215 [Lachnospiraceae bacterium]|nr:hypothetical protein [Lachnospiraceae bacterium]